MTDKEFDNYFKALKDYRESVPEGIWEQIQKRTPGRRDTGFILRWVAGAISAAAAVAAVIFTLKYDRMISAVAVPKVEMAEVIIDDIDDYLYTVDDIISSPLQITPMQDIPAHSQADIPACDKPLPEPEDTGMDISAGKDTRETSPGAETPDSHATYTPHKKRRDIKIALSGITEPSSITGNILHTGGSGIMMAPGNLPTNPAINARDTVIESGTKAYSIPISAGIGIRIPVTERLDVGIGVNYTLLSRRLQGHFNGNYYTDIKNVQQYIGIPVSLSYGILRSDRLNFYVQAGGSLERAISNRFILLKADGGAISHYEQTKGLQWAVSAGIGIEYRITDFMGVYFDPSVRYYFNNHQPHSIRTVQRLQANFEIGLRFRL